MFTHVAIHEAGHVVVLKAVLNLEAPHQLVDLAEPEPRAWSAFTRDLLGPRLAEPTRVAAFLLGGSEALLQAVAVGQARASRFHGLNGPDGSDCDAEMLDLAVVSHGADRWRGSDMARAVVLRDWSVVLEVSRRLLRSAEIDPQALRDVLSCVGPI